MSCIHCKGPYPLHTCEVITDYHARWLDVMKRKEGTYGIIAWLAIKCHNAPLDSTVRNARKTSHLHSGETHKSNEREGNDQKGSRNSCKVKYIPATAEGRTLASFEIDSAIYQQLAIITVKVEIKFRGTHSYIIVVFIAAHIQNSICVSLTMRMSHLYTRAQAYSSSNSW